VIATSGRPVSLSEIAKAMDTNKAAVTRLFYTFTELGFLQRDARKYYQLTPNILTLGYAAICDMGWRDIAKYHLRKLFEEINHTVSLSILEGDEIVFLIRFRAKKHLPFDIRMGTKLPVNCTAMGKVLLAAGNPEITKPVLDRLVFTSLTVHTITRRDVFLEELKRVKQMGYALNDEELSIGNRSIAVPVMDKSGYAVAAIVISVPTAQYRLDELEKTFAPKIVRTAHDISQSLTKAETSPSNGGTF
jgi:IclR family pca regulon transcriptional regulator